MTQVNLQQKNIAQVANHEEEEQLFVASCFSTCHSSKNWLIDSGCTNHMTYNRELFRELDTSRVSRVKIGNGQYIAVKESGTVAIESFSGTKLIRNVLFVPDISQNLLSVGQLLEKGFKVFFEANQCLIKDSEGKDVFRAKMKGKSFALDPLEEEQSVFSEAKINGEIWHKRVGHFNHTSVVDLQRKELVQGLPQLEAKIPNCKTCQQGKQSRLPFKNATWRAVEKLQLIHTDVAGPHRTPSLKGSRYFLIFIDDYSRMCWIYFLKFKSEVAGMFWKFKNLVETQSGQTIQALRSDNGKEYSSNQFNLFCDEAGIEHQLTAPYTPQQNGVSERKNRTIMEMARCLMFEKSLPKEYWVEAANTDVFLLNRLPTKAVEGRTSFEAWYGFKPSLKNLRIFGCLCFVHVPQIKRDKLDKRAEPGIFVGCNTISKAYRIFQPNIKKF